MLNIASWLPGKLPRFNFILCRFKIHVRNTLNVHRDVVVELKLSNLWNGLIWKFLFTCAFGMGVRCLYPFDIVTPSRMQGNVLTEDDNVGLKLMISVNIRKKDLLRIVCTIYASFCCAWIVFSGKIEIDHSLASGAVVSHTATQPWGPRSHALIRGGVASHGPCRQTVVNSYNLVQVSEIRAWHCGGVDILN